MTGMPHKCFGAFCSAVLFDFTATIKLISLEITLCVRKVQSQHDNYLLQHIFFVFFVFYLFRTKPRTLHTSLNSTQNVHL